MTRAEDFGNAAALVLDATVVTATSGVRRKFPWREFLGPS